ncbi:MAG: HEAT repeat domain-containing protein [Planctomycetota bacterium]
MNRSNTTVIVIAICIFSLSVIFPGAAVSQEEDAEKASDLVEQLKEADSYQRGRIINEISESGDEAVPPLLEVVQSWRGRTDNQFVSGCMLALGRIGGPAREATDHLLEALTATDARLRYSAAKALGEIWKGEGGGEDVREVNAALLACFYSIAYEDRGVEAYAPAFSLIVINEIDVDLGGAASVASVPLQGLRNQVGRWAAKKPNSLPPFEEQPWELLFTYILNRPGSEAAQEAQEVLNRRKPLMAVDAIIRTLAGGRIKVGSERWQQLARVVTGISGVSMPEDSEENPASVVEDWSARWLDDLRDRTGEKHREYTLNKFERTIKEAGANPTEEALDEIEKMKSVLLVQLEGPDDLPEDLSPEAHQMLQKPMKIKHQLAQAVQKFSENEEAHRRLQTVKRMQRIVDRREGTRVGRQFLDELVEFAREERRRHVLADLSDLLRDIGGMPVVLTEQDQDEKNKRLEEWLEQVR